MKMMMTRIMSEIMMIILMGLRRTGGTMMMMRGMR